MAKTALDARASAPDRTGHHHRAERVRQRARCSKRLRIWATTPSTICRIDLIPKFAELAEAVPNDPPRGDCRGYPRGRGAGPLSGLLQTHPAKCPRGCCFSKPTMPPCSAGSARPAVRIRWEPTKASPPASAASGSAWSRSAAWPIRSSTPASSTCMSCAKRFTRRFGGQKQKPEILVQVTSFGYRHGVPPDSDLVFDVRFLPNPNYIPAFKELEREESQRGALHPLFSANDRIHRPHLRSADLPSSALYRGGQELSDDFLRLHRRAASQCDDRERNSQAPGRGGISGQGNASRRSEKVTTTVNVGGDFCRDFTKSSKLEWLETNGTGAFAMGTVAGANTRRYHALLVGSLRPPVERYVLLSRIEEDVAIGGEDFALGACQYPGVVTPRGFELFEEFRADPVLPGVYGLDGALSKSKSIWSKAAGRGGSLSRDQAMKLHVRPFLANRDYHSLQRAVDSGRIVAWLASCSFPPLRIHAGSANGITTSSIWRNSIAAWIFARICIRPASYLRSEARRVDDTLRVHS